MTRLSDPPPSSVATTSLRRVQPQRLATWTQAAGWCAAITLTWLVISALWTWLDNRGQPWLSWALELAIGPPLLLLTGSLLAWRGRGWVQRVGWGLLLLLGTMMTEHIIRESLDAWWASR